MITYVIEIGIECETMSKHLSHEEFFLTGCLGEDQQLFTKHAKNPSKQAKDKWKNDGWLITKDKTLCPVCRKAQK